MTGIIIETNETNGFVINCYLIAKDERAQAAAEYAFFRLVKPRHWFWLKKFISRRPGVLNVYLTGRRIKICRVCNERYYDDQGHRCR